MITLGIAVIEFTFLFFLSTKITNALSLLLLRSTKSQKITVYLISILFLPGTIIHELAHMIVAGILFVPVGTIDLMPKIIEDRVRLGSVSIGKTDPIRRMLIGIAPVIVGITLIVSLVYFFLPQLSFQSITQMPLWLFLVLFYSLFQISNTMFSSKKDMEGTIEVLLVFLLLTGIMYIVKQDVLILFSHSVLENPTLQRGLVTIESFLLIPIAIDSIIFLLVSQVKK